MGYTERQPADIRIIGNNEESQRTETLLLTSIDVKKVVRKDPDGTGKYKTVEFYDRNNNLIMRSVLYGSLGIYEYRIETYYDKDGNVIETIRYVRSFDSNSQLVTEEIVND